jgi:hypothetical protein
MAFMASLQVFGPTAGAVVADLSTLTLAFAVEVGLLCLAALLFARIAVDVPVATGKSIRSDLVAGLQYVRGAPAIAGLLLLGAVPGLFIMGSFQVTAVIIVEDVLKESDRYVGFLWGAFGAGIVMGSVLMSLRTLPRRGLLVIMCIVIAPLGYALYGLSETAWLSLAILFVTGMVGPAVFINLVGALIQENTAPAMMGRVMSMYSLSFVASVPAGNALAGVVTTGWGPQQAIVVGGLCASAIGVVSLVFLKRVRQLR